MSDFDVSDFTGILDDMISANEEKENVMAACKEWVIARSAMINMPMNSPDFRQRLNRLSEAENNLVAAIRWHQSFDEQIIEACNDGRTPEERNSLQLELSSARLKETP